MYTESNMHSVNNTWQYVLEAWLIGVADQKHDML